MIVPAFSQGLYGRLRQLAAADWQRYVAHPFVQQLADGTLAENAFRRYLTQDYLFLIHFARSYALLVSKLRALPEMRAAAASMNAILNELPLHVGYCAQWGISEPEMAAQPEAPETTVWQQRGSEARITELSEIFTTATRLEAQFWQMGLNATAETRA